MITSKYKKGGIRMKCLEIEELISLYIDDELDEHTKELLEKHLEECSYCKKEYAALLTTIHICKELPMIELPENYNDSLYSKLMVVKEQYNMEESEETQPNTLVFDKKKKKHFNWKVYASIAAVFLVLIVSVSSLSSLRMDKSSSPQSEMAKDEGFTSMGVPAAPAQDNYGMSQSNQLTKSSPQPNMAAMEERLEEGRDMQITLENNMESIEKEPMISGRKVINNAFINLDIENYDEKFNQIIHMVTSKGGYVEHSDTQYKYYVPENPEQSLKVGNISVRVPENIFISTIDEIKALGIVTNFGMGGQDITMQYRDTASEVENLKIQEQRLREIMAKTNNVNEILEVERELSRVRGDINRLTGNIKRWDDLVALSTINISLNEVALKDKKIQPVSENIWDKAGKGFIRTINGIVELMEAAFIWFISFLPIVLLLIIIALPIMLIAKRILKRRE